MLRVLPFLFVLAVTLYALIDCLRTPTDEVRNLPKLVWALIIVILWLLGAVAWLLFGRPRGGSGRTVGRPGPRPRPRPVAPDDDPDFLKRLQEERWLDERRRERRDAPPPADEPPPSPTA